MAKWKLSRQTYGSEEFLLSEGDEVTIGRGVNNTVTLASLVISRQHCVLNIFRDKVTIKDLKSSNGTYVGSKKISTNTSVSVKESELIGVGWSDEVSLGKVSDNEKFVFKLVKEKSLIDRIEFQNEIELDDIESKVAAITNENEPFNNHVSDKKSLQNQEQCNRESSKADLKRKSNDEVDAQISDYNKVAGSGSSYKTNNDVLTLSSDSEYEVRLKKTVCSNAKKTKLDSVKEEDLKQEVKAEVVEFDYEAFNVKQEYSGYDEEPINLDSDSESESERRWFIRLSQSSPGKAFGTMVDDKPLRESSYSQQNDEDDFVDDLIKIPEMPNTSKVHLFMEDVDEVDNRHLHGISSEYFAKQREATVEEIPVVSSDLPRKSQMIEPFAQPSSSKSRSLYTQSTSKRSPSTSKHKDKTKKKYSKKCDISNSQKEERKKKLKDIATKEKDVSKHDSTSSRLKREVHVKVTSSNRGAFLTEKTSESKHKKKESPKRKHELENTKIDPSKTKSKEEQSISETNNKQASEKYSSETKRRIEHSSKNKQDESGNGKEKQKHSSKRSSSKSKSSKETRSTSEKHSENIMPIKEDNIPSGVNKHTATIVPARRNVKPLSDSENSYSGKPISKVEPLPPVKSSLEDLSVTKTKKKVRFSEAPPDVRLFEIEPGHQMKKTSLVKATLLDVPQMPAYSLEKITLMRILRWNPHWLDEQANNNEPPPILGHNNPPLSVLHYFKNHTQYVQVVGDLLLMEIWECLTQAHTRRRGAEGVLKLSVESLPPAPPPERSFEVFSLSVNVSVPRSEAKSAPRIGELMLVTFGPENQRNTRFFYVHNVRCLPSRPKNVYAFYSVSLHTVYTERMRALRRGEAMFGKSLAYIKNELSLFEAMEYLARSPLAEAILRPRPEHFAPEPPVAPHHIHSRWTETLNSSQLDAVAKTVSAALSERPSIQMIQGPPGTGKSSVICSIIMTYFYDVGGRRRGARGKLLVAATSNAAVDELVIRLLHIRQSLPKNERFRMVRVGRPEAMHPRARDLSSQSLAQRDALRLQQEPAAPAAPAVEEEIGRQEARLNMWKGMVAEAKDPARAAYCQSRIQQLVERIAQLRGGHAAAAGELSAEQLAAAERRIVEGADIVVTTLASAANHKMRGLRRRLALCIVDEAGQAVEPETLVPLTLDVAHLALIGDPQQLPGYICSQRAKKHGLGESLFSRLSSSMEQWGGASPVVLLDVQYRMHPAIADYPNRAFYDGKIKNAVALRDDVRLPPYSVLYISSGDKGQGASGGNEMEAWGVARLVAALGAGARARGLSLAVITPYNAHKDLIRRNLRALQGESAPPVEVNTVDSFQGQERDIVVVSLARSAGAGFLTDAGRMNVMLTRARHALLVCLNPYAMLKNQQWRTLMDDAQARSLCKFLPNKVCQPAAAAADEDILKYLL